MSIQIENISFTYPSGIPALAGVSLNIARGEAVALVGENGAGKTTLAKHLNGLLRPDFGRVLVDGMDTREHSVASMARWVSFAFQNPDDQLFESSVYRELAFGPRNLGLPDNEVNERVEEALELVTLGHERERHPYDLNISQRKLISIAAVLAMRSPIVILDEPTAGQDLPLKTRLGWIVEQLKEQDRTTIVISHDLGFCAEHLETIVVMAGGRILGEGPTEQILAEHDLLRRANVEPPQLVRLALELGMPQAPQSVEGFVAEYASWKKAGV